MVSAADDAVETHHLGSSSSRIATASSIVCRRTWSRVCRSSYILQVPTGGALPTEDGRVQMYPCYSFESHLVAGRRSTR